MKLDFLLFLYLSIRVFGGEMEVRSYRVGEAELIRAHQEGKTVLAKDWLGEVVEKPGFESRFFEEGKIWRNCSEMLGEIIGEEKFEGQGYFDRERKQLVVRADRKGHERLAEKIWSIRSRSVWLEVAVYSVKGVPKAGISTVPKDAKLLGEVGTLMMPGIAATAGTKDGKLKMASEVVIGGLENQVELRFTVESQLEGAAFAVQTGSMVPIGMPWVFEVGSVNGAETVILVMRPDLMLMDGTRADEWILKEEGGAFLGEERLARLRAREVKNVEDAEERDGEVRRLWVPPTLIDFVNTPVTRMGPFEIRKAGGKRLEEFQTDEPGLRKLGVMYDIAEVFQMNGIVVREEDFVIINEAGTKLYAKLSDQDFSLLKGIVMASWKDRPTAFGVVLEQRGANGEVFKRLGMQLMPGRLGMVSLGEDLKARVEAQIDGDGGFIEIRVTLTETEGDLEKASFKTGATLMNGVPRVLQRSFEEETREWRTVVTILEEGKVVDEYLKAGQK